MTRFREISMEIESAILKFKPYKVSRWTFCGVIALIFAIRVMIDRQFSLFVYFVSFYWIVCLFWFLRPRSDPIQPLQSLPGTFDDTRSAMRQLPEFLFWRRSLMCSLLVHISDLLPVFKTEFHLLFSFIFLLFCAVACLLARCM